MSDALATIREWIADAAAAEMQMRAAYVEERILAGDDRVELPYLATHAEDPRRIVYYVPRWRRNPIQRWKVERARREHRRRERQRSWGGR